MKSHQDAFASSFSSLLGQSSTGCVSEKMSGENLGPDGAFSSVRSRSVFPLLPLILLAFPLLLLLPSVAHPSLW